MTTPRRRKPPGRSSGKKSRQSRSPAPPLPMRMSWGGSAGGNGGSFGATSPFDGFPMMGGRAYGWMGFLSPIMFVWWALVIIGIVSLFRWLLGKDRRGGNAIAILEERLARGEITREEFAEMRKLVSSS